MAAERDGDCGFHTTLGGWVGSGGGRDEGFAVAHLSPPKSCFPVYSLITICLSYKALKILVLCSLVWNLDETAELPLPVCPHMSQGSKSGGQT